MELTAPRERIWLQVHSLEQWYSTMQDCRAWFGANWRCQSRVRRKFDQPGTVLPLRIWFEVPDTRFLAWYQIKYAVEMEKPNP